MAEALKPEQRWITTSDGRKILIGGEAASQKQRAGAREEAVRTARGEQGVTRATKDEGVAQPAAKPAPDPTPPERHDPIQAALQDLGIKATKDELLHACGVDTKIFSETNAGVLSLEDRDGMHLDSFAKDSTVIMLNGDGDAGEISRMVGRDENGKLVCYNASIRLEQSGTGLGSKIFSSEVDGLRKLGFDRMETMAEKDVTPDGKMMSNGFYTWPRLGYTSGLLPKSIQGPDGERTVQGFMKTPEGRDWWKKNGVSFKGTFDLKDGSYSMRVLDAYKNAKGIGLPKPVKPDELPSIGTKINKEEIRSTLVSLGSKEKNGSEHLIAVDSKGKVVGVSRGTEHEASIPKEIEGGPPVEIHHNHPDDAPLTMMDLRALATNPEITAIHAYGHNGADFSASVKEGVDRDKFDKQVKAEFKQAQNEALKQILDFKETDREARTEFVRQAKWEASKRAVERLAEAGYIDYKAPKKDTIDPPKPPPPPGANPFEGTAMTALIRYAGAQGMSHADTKATLERLGYKPADATLRRQRGEGKKGINVPELSEEQKKLWGGGAKPEPEKSKGIALVEHKTGATSTFSAYKEGGGDAALTDAQKQAISNWTSGQVEQTAIRDHLAAKSQDRPSPIKDPALQKQAEDFLKAVQKLPSYQGPAHRAVILNKEDSDRYKAGDPLLFHAPASWSGDQGLATSILNGAKAGQVPTLFQIEHARGNLVDIEGVDENTINEKISRPGAKFDIHSVKDQTVTLGGSDEDRKVRVIRLREVK